MIRVYFGPNIAHIVTVLSDLLRGSEWDQYVVWPARRDGGDPGNITPGYKLCSDAGELPGRQYEYDREGFLQSSSVRWLLCPLPVN